jgi:hypothetical protein
LNNNFDQDTLSLSLPPQGGGNYEGNAVPGDTEHKHFITHVCITQNSTAQEFVSILMESPFYFVLKPRERHSLLTRLLRIHRMNRKSMEKLQINGTDIKENPSVPPACL